MPSNQPAAVHDLAQTCIGVASTNSALFDMASFCSRSDESEDSRVR